MPTRITSKKSRQKRLRKQPQNKSSAGPIKSPLEHSDPQKDPQRFNPETLDRTVIAIPLLRVLKEEIEETRTPARHKIIIDLNLEFPGGRKWAGEYVKRKINQILNRFKDEDIGEGIRKKSGVGEQYIFAELSGKAIRTLVGDDGKKTDVTKKEIIREAIASLSAGLR